MPSCKYASFSDRSIKMWDIATANSKMLMLFRVYFTDSNVLEKANRQAQDFILIVTELALRRKSRLRKNIPKRYVSNGTGF
jgi:hypothetical protein